MYISPNLFILSFCMCLCLGRGVLGYEEYDTSANFIRAIVRRSLMRAAETREYSGEVPSVDPETGGPISHTLKLVIAATDQSTEYTFTLTSDKVHLDMGSEALKKWAQPLNIPSVPEELWEKAGAALSRRPIVSVSFTGPKISQNPEAPAGGIKAIKFRGYVAVGEILVDIKANREADNSWMYIVHSTNSPTLVLTQEQLAKIVQHVTGQTVAQELEDVLSTLKSKGWASFKLTPEGKLPGRRLSGSQSAGTPGDFSISTPQVRI